MSNTNSLFLSAEDYSRSLTIAKIYLLKREDDYKKFVDDLEFHKSENTENVHATLANYSSLIITSEGKVLFTTGIQIGVDKTLEFGSFEQLAAYYLARYW